MTRSLTTLLIALLCSSIFGQSIGDLGLPFINNFDRNAYHAGTQNWCIEQDAEQVMWFGNNSMLLWYDGVEWGEVSISNFSVVKSLHSTLNKQLLVGAFQEFGEIQKKEDGTYIYISWLERLPLQYINFSDILKIHEFNGEYYFQSSQYIFVFKDGRFQRAYEAENGFHFSFLVNNRLYVHDKQIGLKEIMPEGIRLSRNGDFFKDKEIWHLEYSKGKLIAITQKQGMYINTTGNWESWDCPANVFLQKHTFYTGLKNMRNELIFGTVQNGVIICNEDGQIKKHINKRKGLQNNTVLSMHIDIEQNLWLGLDHGISYLKISSPFSQLVNEDGFGTGYASIYSNNTLYLGTNQGLYRRQTTDGPMKDYQIIPGSEGQVWNLQEFNGELFCAHHNGLFTVKDSTLSKIKGTEGSWKLLPHPTQSNTYIVGTYSGLGKLTYEQGKYTFTKLKNFIESSRVFEFDAYNDLWMSHGYKGVYRISFNDDVSAIDRVKFYGKAEGLPSESNNEVFKFYDQIAIASIYQVYTPNKSTDKMEAFSQWNDDLPLYTQISKIINGSSNNSYIFSENRLYKASFNKGRLSDFDSNLFQPLQGSFISAFENISFINDDLLVIGVADGFVLYDGSMNDNSRINIPLNIKQITCSSRTTFDHSSDTLKLGQAEIEVPFKTRNILIKYNTPLFEAPSKIKKEVKLNGELLPAEAVDDYTIELDKLRFGDYTLAFNISDISGRKQATQILLNFKVLPPWYLKWHMLMVWIILLLSAIFVIYTTIRKRVEIIKRKEKIYHQRKMIKEQIALKRKAARAEQQVTQMKNESLQKQNRQKAEEIANSTMELVEKNKMLLMVKDTLKSIQEENDIKTRNNIIRRMLKTIDRDLNNKEKWKIFEENFDEVHEDFLNRFKEKHPNITAKDMRLCAFLRMNLSSKEIAPLLSISIRSVEISRYRLRKKIDLPHDVNLTDYIVHF